MVNYQKFYSKPEIYEAQLYLKTGWHAIYIKRGETWKHLQRHYLHIVTSRSADTANKRRRIAPIPPFPADTHS